MEYWDIEPNKNEVEAIENGKIVKVSESYAKREGLLVLRRERQLDFDEGKKEETIDYNKERFLGLDDFRKPLRKDNQVYSELLDNFHWDIVKARRMKEISRKQLSTDIGILEDDLKLIENGVLPTNDFVYINKIQKYLGINLRKDKGDFAFDQNMRKLAEESKEDVKVRKIVDELKGDDIEVVEIDSEI